jgi:hypothetical protein
MLPASFSEGKLNPFPICTKARGMGKGLHVQSFFGFSSRKEVKK